MPTKITDKLGLAAMTVAAIATLLALGLATYNLTRPTLLIPPPAPIKALSIHYDKADLQHFNAYAGDLSKAIAARREDLNIDTLQLFGYSEGKTLAELDQSIPIHVLSMVYESQGHRYAVIDGQLYRQGQNLPDGAYIRSIDMQGAQLVNAGNVSRLTLASNVKAPVTEADQRRNKRQSGTASPEDDMVRAARQMDDVQRALKILNNRSSLY